MKAQLVSIIVPVYNAGAFLPDTLAAIRAQSEENWECICVDDGSSDNSYRLLEVMAALDRRFRIFKRPASLPKGGNSCRNYGFEQSRGDFIQWFDADDLMRPKLLERKLKVLNKHPELDFVVSRMAELVDGEIRFTPYAIDSAARIKDFLAYRIRFFTPGPLFRKSFLHGKALFSTQLKRHQEWEFYGRLLMQGGKYKAINAFHCIRKVHADSINGRSLQKSPLERSYLKLYAVHHLSRQVNTEYAALLCQLFLKRSLWSFFQAMKQFKLRYMLFFLTLAITLIYHFGLHSFGKSKKEP